MRDRSIDRVRHDAGFTLVEILIAIVLTGVLGAVVAVGIGRLTDQAADATCTASADAARTAVNTFYVRNSAYPTSRVRRQICSLLQRAPSPAPRWPPRTGR